MWRGTVVSIQTASVAGGPMLGLDRARLVAGCGVEGDRYFLAQGELALGTFKTGPHDRREVTLVEEEALAALARDYGVQLAAKDTRRNLTTRGVPLNHLVGREFTVGEARL